MYEESVSVPLCIGRPGETPLKTLTLGLGLTGRDLGRSWVKRLER